MYLPESVRACMDALEAAGFACYAVGGCVRDSLLGLQPHDYDLCTAATPAQLCAVFCERKLVLAGQKHGTVGVVMPDGVVEITTFRTEGAYRDCRHPNWVSFVGRVEDDLARRDFTVNAMAYSPTRGLVDPFNGQADLKNRVLRAVGEPERRFEEDALRILRGVRFSVRYRLMPDAPTERAMLSCRARMDMLARERVFEELCKLLPLVEAEPLLRFAPIVTQAVPELAPTVGFDQRSPHHAYPLYTHIAFVTAAVPPTLPLRLAALLHDVGKPAVFRLDETGRGHFPDHALVGAEMADAALRRLKAPNALRERVVTLIRAHMTPLQPDERLLRRRLARYGEETVRDLLALQRADFGSKGTGKPDEAAQFDRVQALLDKILAQGVCRNVTELAISGKDLIAMGYAPGVQLGQCLAWLLECVQAQTVANTPQALQDAARRFFSERC